MSEEREMSKSERLARSVLAGDPSAVERLRKMVRREQGLSSPLPVLFALRLISCESPNRSVGRVMAELLMTEDKLDDPIIAGLLVLVAVNLPEVLTGIVRKLEVDQKLSGQVVMMLLLDMRDLI